MPKLTDSAAAAIVASYSGGLSAKDAGAAVGLSEITAWKLLRSRGLMRPRRYCAVDHHFFDTVDSAHKAYWLGWLFADGCVTAPRRGQAYVSLSLQAGDRDVIERLRAAVGSTHKICEHFARCGSGSCDTCATSGGHRAVRFGFSSGPMADALGRYGVVPRKSFVAVPPRLPVDLEPAFWRGVFEGNGHVSISRDADGAPRTGVPHMLSVCGSFPTCRTFLSFVLDRIGGQPVQVTVGGKRRLVGSIRLGLHRGAAVARILYDGADEQHRLERKHSAAMELIAIADAAPEWRRRQMEFRRGHSSTTSTPSIF